MPIVILTDAAMSIGLALAVIHSGLGLLHAGADLIAEGHL